jgi:two-component system nitrate/nitrite response regulator NarL
MVDTSGKVLCKSRYNRSEVGNAGGAPPEVKTPLKIFIISDVRLCRDGLLLLLAGQRNIEVVGSAPAAVTSDEVITAKPDIVLLDASVFDVRSLVGELHAVIPEIKLVAFAIREVDEEVIACAEAGIAAYVKRESSSEEMVEILHQAARGDFAPPAKLTNSLFRYIATTSPRQRQLNMSAPDIGDLVLTRREKEIIPFIARGLTNKEIARSLGLGPSTVKNHVHNILEKLQLRRRGQISAQTRPVKAPEQGTAG